MIFNQRKIKLLLIVGARPNFIKVSPLIHELQRHDEFQFVLVHTGQHYDDNMSSSFFSVLDIPVPDINLEVGSNTHAVQTARIMERFEPVLIEQQPTAIVVFGDVNSTAACALVASKLLIPTVHVEAGLRSFDRTMPEEINRIVTDAISDLLLVSEPSGSVNLKSEGRPEKSIKEVGNVMIDSLERMRPYIEKLTPWKKYELCRKEYGMITMHRPSNVDDPDILHQLLDCLNHIAEELPLIFMAHPRTIARINALNWKPNQYLLIKEPVSYTDSIALQAGAKVVFTDSGGIQEEASCLNVPCLTMRWNTERPITVERGTSTLVGNDPERILEAFIKIQNKKYKTAKGIPLWDGQASRRIVSALQQWVSDKS